MRITNRVLLALPLLALAPACDGDDPDTDLRSGTLDVDIELVEADGGGDDGTVIWEILEGSVYAGEAASGSTIATLSGSAIIPTDSSATCNVDGNELTRGSASPEVLFTVVGNQVFAGTIDERVLETNPSAFDDQLAISLDGDEVWWGDFDSKVLEASADVEVASDGRKLLIAALLEGHCGSAGF